MDWVLLFMAIGLTIFGGAMIRSTQRNQLLATDWWQHWLFGGVGLLIVLGIARISYNHLLRWHWVTYGLTNSLLMAVIILGSSAKGAQRWINIAGFKFQPSEFAKLGLIITLAAILHHRPASSLPTFLRAVIITIPPWLIVFKQPDLGTSLVFGAILLGMLYWASGLVIINCFAHSCRNYL
jgi:rod shape determining protein RodA